MLGLVFDSVENQIDWILRVVQHLAKFIIFVVDHLGRHMAMNGEQMMENLKDCTSEGVAGSVTERSEIGTVNRLDNLFDECGLDSLYFLEDACFFMMGVS
jgi:hypothetical protein